MDYKTIAKDIIKCPKYTIIDLGNGWYNFEKIPQEKSYIKVANLCCGSHPKAIKQVKNILEANGLKTQGIEILTQHAK